MRPTKALDLIEQAMGFAMSDEQRQILFGSYGWPTLINSCAGAGKTTTLMMSILYNALVNEVPPKRVLGVTFSKQAQLDMQARYQRVWQRLVKLDAGARDWEQPTFKTFHALFLQLLKRLEKGQQFQVVNVSQYYRELYQQIEHPSVVLTMAENVVQYTDMASKLVNFGFSVDGLAVNQQNPQVKVILRNLRSTERTPLQTLLLFFGQGEADYWRSYQRVMTKYRDLKQAAGGLDFDDMQSRLQSWLQTQPGKLKQAQHYLAEYQSVYLDEFQDINPLQWSLLRQLLMPAGQQHLIAIGDDDQSIYAFRGSQADFILHFTEQVPQTQQFNLSTNYRTCAEILGIVKPMIESNRARLAKSLQAAYSGGEIFQATREVVKGQVLADPALAKFAKDVKANADKQQHFAVLSRTNMSLSLVGDQLAEQGVFVNLGNARRILQHTRVYEVLWAVMLTVIKNSFVNLQKMARYLGFRKYQDYVQELQYVSIDAYLKDPAVMKNQQYARVNSALQRMRDLCRQGQVNGTLAMQLPRLLLAEAQQVTKPYFETVLNHHYVNYSWDNYDQVVHHLSALAARMTSFDEFYQHEKAKAHALKQVINQHDSRVQAMTMHSAKGLEFDETLIYEGLASPITSIMLDLNLAFPANLTLVKLRSRLSQLPSELAINDLLLWMRAGLSSVRVVLQRTAAVDDDRVLMVMQNYLEASGKMAQEYHQQLVQLLLDAQFDFTDFLKDHDAVKLLLMELLANAKAVEEEKRIYYVGVTRAKQRIIFDRPRLLPPLDQMLDLSRGQAIYD